MSVCKKVVEAVGAELYNAAFQMPEIGVLKASLSPINQNLLSILDPKRADGLVSFEEKDGGGCVPTVNFSHLDTSGTYAVRTSATCSAPAMTNPKLTAKFTVEQYAESGFSIGECAMNLLCEDLEKFNQIQINGGRSQGLSGWAGRYRQTILANLQKSVKGIITTVNDAATDELVNHIGVNPLYGNDTAQPIKFFTTSEEKGLTRHFVHEMDRLRRRRGISGRLMIVTGSDDLAAWFRDVCNIGCCSDAGINYAAVQTSGFEVYFDYALEAELGSDGFLIVEPEVFATINVDKWRNIRNGYGKDKIAGTQYGAFAIKEPSVRYMDQSCVLEVPKPQMVFDLRVIEKDCADNTAAPSVHFLPSLTYDFWLRPADTDGVTGVYRYKVQSYLPTPAPTWTVTFDSNGGSAVSSITNINNGATISAPSAPTLADHTFAGWFTDAALTQPWTFVTDTVTSSFTLYAKWTED